MNLRAAVLLTFVLSLSLLPASAAPPTAGGDPADGFLPKEDLGVAALRADVPEADGRGILVAVLDTGVDLLHPAFARCPDGSPKIVDFLDATDAGEVRTRTAATVRDGTVIGLSGRTLRLGADVPATVRLGLVRAGETWPGGLLARLRDERRRERERTHRLAADRATDGKAPPMPADPGDPMHDLVLYERDGSWRVRLDADSDGDLAEEAELRDYPVAREVAVLGESARLGVGIRVLPGGEAVSLLFDGGGHGTHVAGIIAGYHGEGSPLNGLAPAARILAVKIGNGRFGGATTHLAVLRGLQWAGRMGADVVNISFGGASLFADGREVAAAFLDDAAAKYGYTVCVSAGNAGPAHGTVGAPATARRALVIGAFCPASSQRTNYGVVHPRGGSLFPFSSRGPLPGGATGVDFLAPGAAVSALPEWGLVSGRNMNGTSMAAPQASGAVAAILSAARAEDLPVSHVRLRRALVASARPVPGLAPVEQGAGLIDVPGALRELRARVDSPEPVDWRVETSGPNGPGGGVVARAVIGPGPIAREARLVPEFPAAASAEERARFVRILRLLPDAAWIEAASPVHAASGGTTVSLRLDPARMPEGLASGLVRVVDDATGEEVARIPVTAVRPRVVSRCGEWVREEVRLGAGDTASRFFLVPPGATVARLETRASDPDEGIRIAFASVFFSARERGHWPGGEPGAGDLRGATFRHLDVREGTVVEVAIHRPFRAGPEEAAVEVALSFRGLDAGAATVVVPAGRFGTHLNLRAGGDVRGRFEGSVEWTEEPLAFRFESIPDPMDPELLDGETLLRHVGTAEFEVREAKAEVRIDFGFETPFEDYLDDATIEVLDANGKTVEQGFVWRGTFTFRPERRGFFTARVMIHERGRGFLRGGAIFSPVLLRKAGRRDVPFRRDVYDGFLPGGPSGPELALDDGDRCGALVLRPDGESPLPLRGSLIFRDEEWKTPLLTLPLEVEPRSRPSAEEVLRAGLEDLLAGALRRALDRDDVEATERKRIADLVAVARAAGPLVPRIEADLLVLASRESGDAARAALAAHLEGWKGKPDPKDLVFRVARAEAALLALDEARLEEEIAKLVNDRSEAAARVRFLAARAKGDHAAALTELDRVLETSPSRPSFARAR
ncbi:MAG: S8 family serine peptidase, partial [Planctomycetes bacterium]|nr:S8 family serine peptidase [Planctomycetota bacterium]